MALISGQAGTEPARNVGGRRYAAVGAVLGAALGAVVSWLMHRTMGDDALISVAYARTLADSGTWGAFPGITANTQTSPLNVWLLAAGIAVAGHPIGVTGALLCACLAACGWLATDLAARLDVQPAAGWLTVSIVGTSPVLVATIGLEAYLGAAILLAIALAAVRRGVVTTGLLCGVAVLTRPDLAVPAALLTFALFISPGAGRGRGRIVELGTVAGVAAVVALPWHVWSWFMLGGAVPDTTWVRTGDRSGPSILPAVPGWVERFPAAGLASLLPVLLALGCAALAARHAAQRWARMVLLLVGAGSAHLVALEAIHAQGAGWYYGPAVACSASAVSVTVAAHGGRRATGLGVVAVGTLALAGVATSGSLPWTSAPLVGNLALTAQYATIAQQLPALTGGEPVAGPGELGALAFYGSVPVLDLLSEPARTDEVMRSRAGEGGLRAVLMQWNGMHRHSAPAIPTHWRLSFGSAGSATDRVVRTWQVDRPTGGTDTLVLTDHG